MKENVLDVLMYLFEHYIDDENDVDPDRETLESQLLDVGFNHHLIGKAFDWLEGLAEQQTTEHTGFHTLSPRIYTDDELEQLDTEGRGFLLFLEQNGIINNSVRELIIDRVMALDTEEVSIEQLKWVVLMVLFNQPGQEAAYTWLEDMVYDNAPPYLH